MGQIRAKVTTEDNCTVAHNCHGKTESHGTTNSTHDKINSRQNTIQGKTKTPVIYGR